MPGKRVLSVGQCSADHSSISRTLQRAFGAEVVPAHSADEAVAGANEGGFALVLVDRVLDADGASGLELVRQIEGVPVMLVSNYADAQAEAVAAGAVPGFGKSALGSAEMLARVAPYLAGDGVGQL